MDPTQPLNLLPQAPAASPYSAPNNPYQQMGPVANVIAALKAGAGGANAAQSQSGGQSSPQAGQAGAQANPNFYQFGQTVGTGIGKGVQDIGSLIGNATIPSFTP